MRKFGLIGRKLEHSFSLDFFTQKFQDEYITDTCYQLFPLRGISLFPYFIESQPDICGLNVTIPYKKSIMYFLDEIDPIAETVGAVNVIKFDKNRKSIGYNTDVFGFKQSLLPLLKPNHTKALILGTGGVAHAVMYVLKELKIDFCLVSRYRHFQVLQYQDLNLKITEKYPLIINTTPVGMFPEIEKVLSFPFQYLNEESLCFDLIYNPQETTFMQKAAQYGATTQNGLQMLYLQAEKAWEIWNI